MSLLNAEIYDALLAVGAPEEKARKAAESVTEFHRLVPIEAALTRLDARIGKLERDTARLQWAVTANVGLTLTILAKLFLG
jgi:hypothetical protein